MADHLIGVKIVPDAKAVQQTIRELEAQRTRSGGGGRPRSGFSATKANGAPLETEEQSGGPRSKEALNNLVLAQNRYADLLEEKTRRERQGISVGQRIEGAGIQGYTDRGLVSELGKAQATVQAWVNGVTREMTAHARGTNALLNDQQALQAAGLREMMRQTWGRVTRQASDEARQDMGMPTRYQENQADQIAYQRQRNAQSEVELLKARQQAERDIVAERNRLNPGTRFQRFQAAASPMPKAAEEYATGGQYMKRHLANTLGYAIPGIAIGLGFEEFRRALEESQKAQRSMAEVRAEFEGLGQSSQFSAFANSIKGIASETGVAVSEVAQLGIAMKGVFGDTSQATIATNAIAQATVTMGMSLQQAREDLIGITQGFSDLKMQGGSAMMSVQNELLHLQDLTGVEAKDLAPGLADVASTANIVGFSSKQTASMVAAAAQHSGLSSATIGETLSKIITALSSNPTLLTSTENLLGATGNVPKNISSQSLSTQIRSVMAALPSLGPAEYQAILGQLGINSSALPAANALFATGNQASALANTTTPGNRAEQEFKKQMDTLAGRLTQLRSDFTNLGVAILNSGFGKFLTEVAQAAGKAVNFMTDLGKYTHGLATEFMGLIAALLAVKAGLSIFTAVSTAMRNLTIATGAATVAEEENAAANSSGIFARGAGAVGGNLGAIGAVLASAMVGHQIGSFLYNLNQGHGVPSEISRVLTSPITAPARFFGHLLGGGGPSDTTKYGAQQQSYINQHLLQMRAVEGLMNPKDRARFERDLAHDTHSTAYQDLLGLYNQYGQSQQGQAAIQQINARTQQAQQARMSVQQVQAAMGKYLGALYAVSSTDIPGSQAAVGNLQIGGGQLLQTLTKNMENLRDQWTHQGSAAAYEAYEQAQTQVNQQMDAMAQGAYQLAASVANGNPQQAAALVQQAAGLLAHSKTAQALTQNWQSYISAAQAQMQAQAQNATTAQGAISAQTQNFSIPDSVRQQLAQQLGVSVDQIPASYQGYMSPQQKFQTYQQYNQAAQALKATQSTFGASDPLQQAKAAQQAALANMQALKNSGDNNTADLQNAQAALNQANQQLADASTQQTQAIAGMYAAMFANAPLQAAQYQMQALQAAYANAHSAAEQSQIKGQISQLQQQIAQDTIQLADAQNSITVATLTAKGNPIAAAFAKYQQDLRDIASRETLDRSLGVNQNQDTQLQQMIAQSISDNTSYLQTQFSTLQQTAQNELYLGQITATQAIIMLEQGMAAAKGNALLVQQYQVAIRQIQNSAGANLNFDLPQNLLIQPTLYQAARVDQLRGGSYQSTRQVVVNINVNNSSQNPGAVQQLINALGGPPVGSVVNTGLGTGL